MTLLKGKVLDNNIVIKEVESKYYSREGFFLSLVSICDKLDIDVPIWSYKEDKALERYSEVSIPLDSNQYLIIEVILNYNNKGHRE